jgi:hypothetical protein
MQAKINRFNTQARQDPNFIYQAHSPAGNQYDQRNFSTVDSNMTQGIRQRQVNDGPIDLKTMGFENTYFTNPRTGQKFGSSIAEGPSGWVESRHIYPDASGYGSYYDEEGNYSEYPIQLKGPQTWNYDPVNFAPPRDQNINDPRFEPGTGIFKKEEPGLPDWWNDNLGSGEGTYWNVKANQPDRSGIMQMADLSVFDKAILGVL